MKNTIEAANDYILRGWRLYPAQQQCRYTGGLFSDPVKIPTFSNGAHDASADPEQIEKWFKDQSSIIAIRTGEISNLFVLGINPHDYGVQTLDTWELEYGDLPKTPVVDTGYRGLEYYFKYPGILLRSEGIGRGVHVYADGSAVVAPPATLFENSHNWHVGLSPSEVDLADVPKWLLNKCMNLEIFGTEEEALWKDYVRALRCKKCERPLRLIQLAPDQWEAECTRAFCATSILHLKSYNPKELGTDGK